MYSIPAIYRLRDGNGDGKADKRDRLYTTFGAADTHGMTNAFMLNFDGWVYACHGFSNRSHVKGSDNAELAMHSGNTYRMRTDGSHAEAFTHGQVNPFGLSVDPLGYLYSADCHSQPIYQLIRDGYYPSFGKPNDGLGWAPETITNYRGSTAISGIAYYAADAFPKKYQGSAFVGDVMTNEIVQFDLTWNGTSPRAVQRVLLHSKDQWFRPVDIKLGPDGALYIADFYNRIIGHYEVPLNHPGRDRHRGRIWRIVYTGKDHKATPAPRKDFAAATATQLAGDLEHPNLTVRLTATNALATRGRSAIEAVRKKMAETPAASVHSHGLWVLERLGVLSADELAAALKAEAVPVRVHACRVLSERKKLSVEQSEQLRSRLSDDSSHVRRVAADALGQHPDPSNVLPLLRLRQKTNAADNHLVYVVRQALRNQLRSPASWEVVREAKLSERDARDLADVALAVPTAEAAHAS